MVLSHPEQSASITELINNMIHLRTSEVARKGGWFAYSSVSQQEVGEVSLKRLFLGLQVFDLATGGLGVLAALRTGSLRTVALRVRPMASLRFSYGLQPILSSRTTDFRRWFAIHVLSDPCVNNYKELQRFTSFAGYGLLFLDRKVLYLGYSDFDHARPRCSR